jgi:small-conductance mechanosensitive channel
MMFFGDISLYLILFFSLALTGLIAFYYLLNTFVIPAIENRKYKAFFIKWAFRSQLLLWVLFILFFTYQFFMANPAFTLLILSLSLALGWSHWRNLINALLFKIENRAKLGDHIKFGETSGKIVDLGKRNILLQKDNGEQIVIPQGKLVQDGYTLLSKLDSERTVDFLLDQSVVDHFGSLVEFEKFLVNNPWVEAGEKASLHPVEEGKWKVELKAIQPEDRDRLKNYILAEIKTIIESTPKI